MFGIWSSNSQNKKLGKENTAMKGSLKKSMHTYSIIPEFGPIEIDSYSTFIEKSKEGFLEKWDQESKRKSSQNQPTALNEIKKLKVIGAGSFGKVFLVQNQNNTDNVYAMKAIAKSTIVKYKQVAHTKAEKLVLSCTNCPFTLYLINFYQDNSYIYFVVPFAQGGELYTHLQRASKFNEITAMFYASQVIMALEYLHFMDILYRDLKPENILMDHTGYLKLADFGFCKRLTKGRTYSLCGTPEYLAPEVILSKGYGKAVDWWGVGILMYELAAGYTPFRESKAMRIYEKVLKGSYKMPSHFSEDLKDIVRHVLQADTSKRYGNLKDGVYDFKNHKWFRPLNWQAVASRKLDAPFVPKFKEPMDTTYFREHNYESLVIAKENSYESDFDDF